jgi:DNA/RNA endonuclease YhcR with UshA esterase domain
VVGRITHTQEGGHLILDVGGLQVFIPASAAQGHTFRMGDTISLYGTVQTYRGKREIVVQDGEDIRSVSPENRTK